MMCKGSWDKKTKARAGHEFLHSALEGMESLNEQEVHKIIF
jgi:hypothetical protein